VIEPTNGDHEGRQDDRVAECHEVDQVRMTMTHCSDDTCSHRFACVNNVYEGKRPKALVPVLRGRTDGRVICETREQQAARRGDEEWTC
jgi:hypothetical protein